MTEKKVSHMISRQLFSILRKGISVFGDPLLHLVRGCLAPCISNEGLLAVSI